MQKRTKAGQRRHDLSVLRSANHYKGRGFKVKADLPNFVKPKKIKKFVPDLIAKKGEKEIILEIETQGTNEKDKEQQQAFREYAGKSKGKTFKKKVI